MGKIKIDNGYVTFTSLPKSGYMMGFDDSIVFIQEGNKIEVKR